MRINCPKVNKVISWLTIITLIIQVVLPGGLFNFDVPKADAAITVAVTYPNGGEDLDIGDTAIMTWTTTQGIPPVADPDFFKLYYSENGGTDWTLIDGNVPYTGTPQNYNWEIPVISGPNENDAQVKVEAHYTATGLITSDTSNANFNIDYGPVASFVVDLPAETAVNLNTNMTITAKDTYGNTITNYANGSLTLANNSVIASLTTNGTVTPSPATITAGGTDIYSSVTWSGGATTAFNPITFSVADNNGGVGTVSPALGSDTIVVVANGVYIDAPISTTVWTEGDTGDIVFRAGGETTISYLKIYYSNDSGSSWNSITNNLAPATMPQTYTWSIPTPLTHAGDTSFQIKVESYDSGGSLIASDTSDTFKILDTGGRDDPSTRDTESPTSKVLGIVNSSGGLVSPMPVSVLTSRFTIVAEASDTGTPVSGVDTVALYWGREPSGPYANYGNATTLNISGVDYYSWSFLAPENDRYYFYSLAIDNADNIEQLPKSFWTGIITYDDTTMVDAKVPKILGTVPLDKQVDIGINTTIRVLFDYNMDKASVEQAFSVKRTSDGSGNFTWVAVWTDSNRTVTFSPATGQVLAYDTDYTAFVDPNIAKSKDGEKLSQMLPQIVPNPWTFRTAAKTTTDLSTSTKVPDKNICSAGETITYTIVLRNTGTATANVTFSDSIPANTIYDNYIRNIPANGGATYDSINKQIVWSGTLARNGGNRTIQFRVLVNQPLPNDTRITNIARMSDGTNPAIEKYGITIISSPLGDITSITPINNAQDIANNTTIRFAFSLAMNKPSVEQAFKLIETVNGNSVTGLIPVWSNLDRTLVYSLPIGQTLKYFTGYTIVLDKNIAITTKGAPLKDPTTAPIPSQFTTAKQRVPDVTPSIKISNVDVAQPYDILTYTITLKNSGTAAANVSFMDYIPANTAYYSVSGANRDTPITTKIWWDGTLGVNISRIITLRVRVNTPLPNGTMITNDATIDDHFNSIIHRYATTLIQSPTAKILLTVPANSEVNVATRPSIKITFSETMDRASVQNAFSITKVSGDPDGPLTWSTAWSSSDKIATFTLAPNQNLGYEAIYSVFIDPTVAKTRKGASLDTVSPVSNPFTFTTATPNMSDSSKPVDLQVAQAGQQLTYNMVLRNTGTAPANFTFVDQLPLNTTYVSVRNATWDKVNQKIWTNRILAVGATWPITFVVKINSPLPNGTVITNSAVINDGFHPAVIKNAQTLVLSPLSQILITSPMNGEMNVATRPTMRITFSRPMDRVSTQSAFSLIKTSGGTPDPAFNFVYAWATGDTIMTVTLVTVQSLAYSATYQAKIDTDIAKTKLGAPVDPASPAANPWVFNTALLNTPNLTTSTKAVNLQVANPGSVLLYTVVLRNTSDFPATVSVDDYIPANASYDSYKAGVWVYDIALKKMTLKNRIMAARSTLTMTYQAEVDSILPNGTIIINEVQINDGVNPIFSKFAETYIQAHTDFTTSYKSAVNDNSERATGIAQPGDTLTFTITVNNTGNMDAINTLITDLVPPNTAFVEESASSGFIYDVLTRTLKWLGTVPVQTGKVLTFKATVDSDENLFLPPNDKVINDAVITDTTNSFSVKSSTTIVLPPPDPCPTPPCGGHHPNNPPYLMEVEPTNGTKSVKLYSPIVLKFSENVDSNSLQYIARIGERPPVDTKNWRIDESGSSATLTLRPDKPLESGSTYTIQIVDIIDMDGQSLGTDGPIPNNTFSFSTVRPMLYFVNKQVLTFRAGTISEAIKVKLGDWLNYDDPESTAPIYADYAAEDLSGISIQLWGTSATGRFDVSPTGNFEKNIIHIIMPQGSSEITFYYTDSQVNAPLIYKMVAYAPYTSYLIYGDLRYVSTNSSGGGDNLQNRIQFITESQNVPVNFFSNPIEFEILSPDGAVILLEAGKIFLLNTTSATGTFYNSFKLPLDNPVNYEGRNYYQLAIPSANTKATFYYKDSTPGPYEITVKESGVISTDISNSSALDATQLITIISLKDQDWDEDVLIKNIVDDSGRKLSYIVVEPDDVILLPGAKQTFRAKGYDIDGKLIESLEFGWYVISDGGTIRQPYIGSHSATFTAGRTAGIYYDTVLAAAMYNGDLQGGYATVRVADVVDYGGPGHLPSTGPNGIQMIFILLMLFSAVALAEVEHYERTHFGRMAKPKGIK